MGPPRATYMADNAVPPNLGQGPAIRETAEESPRLPSGPGKTPNTQHTTLPVSLQQSAQTTSLMTEAKIGSDGTFCPKRFSGVNPPTLTSLFISVTLSSSRSQVVLIICLSFS